jgi:alanine racemase
VRPSRIEIDLTAIRHNIETLAARTAPAEVIAVVKANAYGHGDVPVSEVALESGASWLAVAMVEEAARLREAGIDAPILLLSEPPISDAGEVRRWNSIPSVYRPEFVDALAEASDQVIDVQMVVDTGMHRVGVAPEQAVGLARRIVGSSSLRLAGMWTHFAVAEDDEEFSRLQVERFEFVAEQVREAGIDLGRLHLSNSAGVLHLRPEATMARVGLGMYGLHPDPKRPNVSLRPAMRVVSRVGFTQRLPAGARPSYGRRRPLPADANVATVPIGYADGVPRLLSQRNGEVLIGGVRRPFAGTITMDQIVIDCGDDPVEVGDEVVLLGRQGNEEITADEWAARTETISWEIVTRMGERLPRRYIR